MSFQVPEKTKRRVRDKKGRFQRSGDRAWVGGGDGEQLYKKGWRQDRRGDTPRRYKKSWRQGTGGPQITPTTFFVLMRRAATATITKKTVNQRKEKMRESRREDIRLQETLPSR